MPREEGWQHASLSRHECHWKRMSLWVTNWIVRSSEKEGQAGEGKSQSQLPSHPTADPE